jgi:hypothetical protein
VVAVASALAVSLLEAVQVQLHALHVTPRELLFEVYNCPASITGKGGVLVGGVSGRYGLQMGASVRGMRR